MKKTIAAIFVLLIAISGFAQNVMVRNGSFYSVYNLELQCPSQVEWRITTSDLGDTNREPYWKFRQDITHPLATARHNDYKGSGYDRGHMCPAQDRSCSKDAMRSTFVMSNIAPQVPSLNRGEWKSTEIFCRQAALLYDSVEVLAMPIFLDRDTMFIGSHRLAVPHAFIKVAWLPLNDSVIGTWFYWNQ